MNRWVVLIVLAAAPAALGQRIQAVRITDAIDPIPGSLVKWDVPLGGATTQAASSLGGYAQHPGFPIVIGGSVSFSTVRGLVLEDIDGDASVDLVVSSTDQRLYAFDISGRALPGFPVALIGLGQYPASIADLDGDGLVELVQVTRGITSGGRLHVFEGDGSVRSGFPLSFTAHNLEGAPTLADLDGDGQLEILVQERIGNTSGILHVIAADGTEWAGAWPFILDHIPTGTPAVGDIDGDGGVDIVFTSYMSLYVLNESAHVRAGFPIHPPNTNFSYQSPTLADLDADGTLEIVVGAHQVAAGVYVFKGDGSPLNGWPRLVGTWTYCPPMVVDLDGDGSLDVLTGREGVPFGASDSLFAWSNHALGKLGFPYVGPGAGGCAGALTCADIDNDGKLEIFADHTFTSGGLGYVLGVDSNGVDLPGFPLRPVGATYLNGARLADVDGDGDLDLGALSFHDASIEINLWDLGTPIDPARIPCPTYHVDASHRGREGDVDRLHVVGSLGAGDIARLQLVGAPKSPAWLWIGVGSNFVPLPPYGFFRVAFAPPPLLLIGGAPLSRTGSLDVPITIPAIAAISGVSYYLQALTTDLHGQPKLTNLVRKTVP